MAGYEISLLLANARSDLHRNDTMESDLCNDLAHCANAASRLAETDGRTSESWLILHMLLASTSPVHRRSHLWQLVNLFDSLDGTSKDWKHQCRGCEVVTILQDC